MARAKKINEEKDAIETKELVRVQEKTNKELVKEKKEIKKKKEDNMTYLFFNVFFTNLKENKLYLLSLFITVFAFVLFSATRVQKSDGIYSNEETISKPGNVVTPVVETKKDKVEEENEIDISDYIGIYSKVVKLNDDLVINNSCTISSYKLVYQVKKDKTIAKYFYNDCLGTIQMWNDSITYVSSGGARYISANNINYLFSPTNMKEVDGDTYNSDTTITTLKEKKKIDSIDVYFYNNNIVLNTKDNLLLVKGSAIAFNLNETYPSVGGSLEERVIKSDATRNQFNFIVFNTGDENSCYEEYEDGEKDSLIYTIYSIKYNTTNNTFDSAKEVQKRNKSEKCDNYKDDLALLEDM